MWMVLQLLVAFAAISANIYWQFTPNPVVAGLMGFGAAWLVTYCVSWCLDRWKRAKAELGNERP